MEPVAAPPSSAPARPIGESEWGAFLDSYGRCVIAWFRRSELANDEAVALAKEVLQLMAREFAQFAKEPVARFRGWLKNAAHTAWCRVMEVRVESGVESAGSAAANLLLSDEAHDKFMKALDRECSHQRRRAALPRAQASADPVDWEAFWLTVVEWMPTAEVAAHLQGSELAVLAAVHRVRRMLGDELKQLEDHR